MTACSWAREHDETGSTQSYPDVSGRELVEFERNAVPFRLRSRLSV